MRSLENTSAATKRSLTLSISRPLLVPSARRKPPASGCSSRCHPNFRVVYAAGKTIRLLATACAKISAPFLLTLPAHRLARRVLRLEPRLRRPAAIGRIHPLRHDALQPHPADMIEDGRAVPVRCSMNWIGSRLALPISFLSRRLRSISGRSRRSSPSCSIRSKAYSTASWPRLGSAAHGSPASRRRGRSPPRRRSGTTALMRSAASTMAGKRSAQSWPLRVKQRTREPSRRTISR